MERPYIICHMVMSVDGYVTGDFLYKKECEEATEIYYDINRNAESNGFICGRVTMEGSFTQKWYPNLDEFEAVGEQGDFVPLNLKGRYAVAFDTMGRLGWKKNVIEDDDPGYGGARIIEVLSRKADKRYLGYLREKEVPYIFAGEDKIDVNEALCKLKALFGIERLLLEGGSIINGAFLRAGAVDELSLMVAPVTGGCDGRLLFDKGEISNFRIRGIKQFGDNVWLNYEKRED